MDYAVLLGLSAGLGGVLLHSSGCVGVGVHDVVQLRGVGHEVVEFGAGPLARGEVFPAAGAQGYLSAVVLRQDVVAVAGCVGPQEQADERTARLLDHLGREDVVLAHRGVHRAVERKRFFRWVRSSSRVAPSG